MLAKINSSAIIGLDGVIVDVNVSVLSKGLPSLSISGLSKKVAKEVEDRIRTALYNTGVDFPPKNITINLTPIEIPKYDLIYDLPIVVGILLVAGEIDVRLDDSVFIGEISSDGSVKHASGILSKVLSAKKHGIKNMYIPKANAREAAAIKGISIFPVESLKNLVSHLTNHVPILPQPPIEYINLIRQEEPEFDLKNISGQFKVKRAFEIAAAGGHYILLNGSFKSENSILVKAFPTILPSLTKKESFEITKIHSVIGNIHPGKSLITQRPFRSPLYSLTKSKLIGGGSNPKPGEISLAHQGVLFLDNFPKYPKSILEKINQSINQGYVQIHSLKGAVTFPTKFTLILATNSCPCGNDSSENRECTCSPNDISRYQKKVSDPILDKIDLFVQISKSKVAPQINSNRNLESSTLIRNRVEKAREIQAHRYFQDDIKCNANLSMKKINKFSKISPSARSFLTQATAELGLTASSYEKIIKISQTIADLASCDTILPNHIAESLQFRFIS
jgi:magnesium chelatase family protein